MYILTPCEWASASWNFDNALYSGVDPADGPAQDSSTNGSMAGMGPVERATFVVLSARIGRGPAGLAPGEFPVAVDVGTDTGVAGHGSAVLAPQPRSCLRVDEACLSASVIHAHTYRGGRQTIRVDNGEDVKVVLVDEAAHRGRVGTVIEKLVGDVLVHHLPIESDVISTNRERTGRRGTVVIHSRACTVLCMITAGRWPPPLLPKMWMLEMLRPWYD